MDERGETRARRAVEEATKIEGWMSEAELLWLARTALRNTTIVEVGSWKGRSTRALAVTPGTVYAVDEWGVPGDNDEVYREAKEKGGDAILEDFRKNLYPLILSGKVIVVRANHRNPSHLESIPQADVVFIDGDHRYECVKGDILNYAAKVKVGGVLSGHDYSPDLCGVVQAVKELLPHHHVAPNTSIWYVQRKKGFPWPSEPS